jgi:hypothetical protein
MSLLRLRGEGGSYGMRIDWVLLHYLVPQDLDAVSLQLLQI